MDFNLPKQAYVNKFIPKNKFFLKASVNSKLKQENRLIASTGY